MWLDFVNEPKTFNFCIQVCPNIYIDTADEVWLEIATLHCTRYFQQKINKIYSHLYVKNQVGMFWKFSTGQSAETLQ